MASSRHGERRSWVRSAGSRQNSRSRAACTRVPRGGGDRRRLGQVVDGREPERQPAVGEGRDLRRRQARGQRQRHGPRVRPGCDSAPGPAGSEGRRRRRRTEAASSVGASRGPKWLRCSWSSRRPCGQRLGDRRARTAAGPTARPPQATTDRAADLAEVLEGRRGRRRPRKIRASSSGRQARWTAPSSPATQPVADVGVEGVGAGHVQRRLGREVGEGASARSANDGRRRRGALGERGCRPASAAIAPGGGTIGS